MTAAELRFERRIRLFESFAEHLSVHGIVAQAAEEAGCSRAYGRVLFARIKKQLGDQAR